MIRIALINDQPPFSGMGRYAFLLHSLLKKNPNYQVDHWYINYAKRELVLNGKVLRRFKDFSLFENKFIFLARLKISLPRYDIYHLTNQNLSFLWKRINIHPAGLFCLTCHDIAPLFGPIGLWEKTARRFLYSGIPKVQRIIADSLSTKRDLMNKYWIPDKKIKVIYLGVDRNIFRPYPKIEARKILGLPEDKKIIINVGTETWRKNIPTLLAAFASILISQPDALLIRVGEKSKLSQKIIRSLKLESSIDYRRTEDDNHLALFYASSDLAIFPSFYEGFGLPVLEAMACGVPVIASNSSSLPELVGEAGLLVAPDDVKQIAEAAVKVLTLPMLANELSGKSLERATHFSWEKTVAETILAYQELIPRIRN